MTSIRRKITVGYYAFAAVAVALALFAFGDLRYLEQRIQGSADVSAFFDTILEARRYEKNYLLYRLQSDHAAASIYAERAERLLDQNAEAFAAIVGAGAVARLRDGITEYRQLLARYAAAPPDDRQELGLRESGRRVAEAAEVLSDRAGAHFARQALTSRHALIASVAVVLFVAIVIGQLLSRATVRPLAELERKLTAIGQGRFHQLELAAKDREMVSVATAVNRMLRELDVRQRHLVQSEKLASLGTLVSGVAHELNNPLSNISSSSQILEEELEQAPLHELRELVRQIDEETERARRIVGSLLDFSRDQAFSARAVAVAEVVDKAVALLRRSLASRVTLLRSIPADLKVLGDPPRLQQVFVNLIKNALDAGQGELTLRIEAERCSAQPGAAVASGYLFGRRICTLDEAPSIVLVRFRDDGPGIPAALLPRIFDPFFTTKDVGHGSGLGLFVAHEIIDQHGGCIGVASEPGKGTEFIIGLPAAPQEEP